jgi:hypothetical protein
MNLGTQHAGVIDVACCRRSQNARNQIPAPAGDVAESTRAAAGPRVGCYCRYLTLVSKRASGQYGELQEACAGPQDVYEIRFI